MLGGVRRVIGESEAYPGRRATRMQTWAGRHLSSHHLPLIVHLERQLKPTRVKASMAICHALGRHQMSGFEGDGAGDRGTAGKGAGGQEEHRQESFRLRNRG